MFHARWMFLASLYSVTTAAAVSFEEKAMRVEYLEKLSTKVPSLYVEAYKRELNYEKENLSLKTRAQYEANLLAEKIKLQITSQFTKTAELLGDSEAAAKEIELAIEKDLTFVSPELHDSLKKFSLDTLEGVKTGDLSNQSSLEGIEDTLLKGIKERSVYLNRESLSAPYNKSVVAAAFGAAPEKLSYRSKTELAEELANDDDNGGVISTTSTSYESEESIKSSHGIAFQLKGTYLGVDYELGPKINFSREFNTRVFLQAEGLEQIFRPGGDFEFYKVRGSKKTKRKISFSCKTALKFSAEYTGTGSLRFLGTGYEYNNSRRFSDTVEKNSRQIRLPETIAGKYTTIGVLREMCINEFLATHLSNGWRIRDVLQIDMEGVISSLRLIHPKTRCAQDNHCFNWYNKLGTIYKANTYPRCIAATNGEGYASCELRGLKRHACSVYENGKRVSTDQFERVCDGGLACYKVREAGWLQDGIRGRLWSAPKGECH